MENTCIKQHTVTEPQLSQEILLQWLKPQFSKVMSLNCHLLGEKHWFFSVAILLEEFLSFDIKNLYLNCLHPGATHTLTDKFKTRDFLSLRCNVWEHKEEKCWIDFHFDFVMLTLQREQLNLIFAECEFVHLHLYFVNWTSMYFCFCNLLHW